MRTPLIIAHRTCPRHAPENSIEGIRKAAELGADAVEIDLRLSLDQQPFLLHDWSLHRTTGFWPPLELTPSPIAARQRMRGGEPLPRLSDAFDALPETMVLAVDVKTPWAVWHLVREARRRGVEDRVLAWCTSARAVRYVVRRAPAIETAYLKDLTDEGANIAYLDKASALGAQAVSADWRAINPAFVMAAHDRGLKVYSWHKEFELTTETLTSGIDGLITDYPLEARAAVESAFEFGPADR